MGRCKYNLYADEDEILRRYLTNPDKNDEYDGINGGLSQFYDNTDLLGKIYAEYFLEEFGKHKVVYYHFDKIAEQEYQKRYTER